MSEPYYETMLNYLTKNEFLTLNLISQNKYIITCFIKIDKTNKTLLILEVFYKNHKRFTINAQKDTINPDDLKNLFKVIESQPFCLNEFCFTTIYDPNDLIDDKCFRCAFYNDYKQTITDNDCSICLEPNNIFSVELNCGHIFHKNCLLKSCDKACFTHFHSNCPLCRCELLFDKYMNQINNCEKLDTFTLDHVDTDYTI